MHRIRLPLVVVLTLLSLDELHVTAAEPSRKTSTADLVRSLDSAKFTERDAAQKELQTRDAEAAKIRRLLPTLGAEGRKRANAVLQVLMQRRTQRFLQYGREGRVDLLVEWSTFADKLVDAEQFWQCVLDIAWERVRISKKGGMDNVFGRLPAGKYSKFLKDRPSFIREFDTIETAEFPDHLLIRCDKLTSEKHLDRSVVVSSGSVDLGGLVRYNFVLANGDINIKYPDRCVLIADGDVRIHITEEENVIIARGKIDPGFDLKRMRREYDSTVRRREPEMYDLLYRPGEPARRIYLPGPVEREPEERVVEVARVEEPPPRDDGVRFFEFSDLGVKLDSGGGKLRFDLLQPDSPLAKAGLKPGDSVVAIDGAGYLSYDAARRSLRRAFVFGGCEISVERGDKELRVPISFFGWELPAVKKPALPAK